MNNIFNGYSSLRNIDISNFIIKSNVYFYSSDNCTLIINRRINKDYIITGCEIVLKEN